MTNSDAARAPVTVIGLGLMGQALAAAFLKDGHPTTVWNRSAGKAAQLVVNGGTVADSVESAVAASPLVIICVTDYDVVHALLDPLDDVLAGKVLVDLTTATSEQARGTAEWAAQRNIQYLDGAIMAVPPAIGTDEAVLLYSGPKEVFDSHEATLKGLGAVGTTYLDVDHGLSSLYDMSLLGIMWSTLNSFLHGAALLGTAKVKATTFAPLANTMINVVTGYVTDAASQIDAGNYPADDATIDIHLAAMNHLVHESESLGVNPELPRFVKTLTDRAVAQGRGGDSYAAMIEQFRTPLAPDSDRLGSPRQQHPADPELAADGTVTPFDPHTLLAESGLGVLATLKASGRPQLSPVQPFYDRAAGVIYVSISEGAAKIANLRRDPRAALEVTSPDGWAWATAEGTVALTGPGTDRHGFEVQALVDYYRRAAGEHPDWDEYRSVMVTEKRVLLTMTADHVYGTSVH